MSQKILASQIMTTEVVVANQNNKFSQVLEFFTEFKIHHLPVAENDKPVGIISLTDITRYIKQRLLSGAPMDAASLDADFEIVKVMTPNPVSVTVDTPLEKVIEILAQGSFQDVLVVKEGLIHGIITNKDLVRVYKWDLENNR